MEEEGSTLHVCPQRQRRKLMDAMSGRTQVKLTGGTSPWQIVF